jgi:hypothetical protein
MISPSTMKSSASGTQLSHYETQPRSGTNQCRCVILLAFKRGWSFKQTEAAVCLDQWVARNTLFETTNVRNYSVKDFRNLPIRSRDYVGLMRGQKYIRGLQNLPGRFGESVSNLSKGNGLCRGVGPRDTAKAALMGRNVSVSMVPPEPPASSRPVAWLTNHRQRSGWTIVVGLLMELG